VERLKPLFTNGHTITTSILGFTDDVTQLLDTLSTRACSVSKLEPIISGLPWLHDALIKAVNSSEYRRIDSKGRVIIVETIRTALSAMGIENLRILLPFFIFRQGTPQITDPFPQIKTKLAEYHTATANGMMRLAKLRNMNVFEAYTLGFFSGLGKCAVIRQYFREYDRALQAYGKDLMKQGDFETYKALQLVQPSASDVIAVCDQFADEITTRMLEYMLFKRIRLLQPWVDADSPMRKAHNISSEYAKLKVLLRYRLIDKMDAKDYLHTLRIDRAALTELNKPEIFRLAVDHTQTHVDK
jgi:hypothetical protein